MVNAFLRLFSVHKDGDLGAYGTHFFLSLAVNDRDTRNMRLCPNYLIHNMFFYVLTWIPGRSDQAKLLATTKLYTELLD